MKKYLYIFKDFVAVRSKTSIYDSVMASFVQRVSVERVNNQAGLAGRINVFSSTDRSRIVPRALSICNADKMEMPERICKSSRVISSVAANDESDSDLHE